MTWQETILDWLNREERSQAWLARKAVINDSYLSAILNDLRSPGSKVLHKLDRAMVLPLGTLEGLRSQMELALKEGNDGHGS